MSLSVLGVKEDKVEVNLPGLRLLPDPIFEKAGRGLEVISSAHNNQWAVKRAAEGDGMGYDCCMLLVQEDKLLSKYFA